MIPELLKYKEYLLARNRSDVYFNYSKLWVDYCFENNIDFRIINQENITNFFNSKDYSFNSRNNFIKSGRDFYNFLGIEDNEWKKIALLKTERKIPNYLSEKELDKAISYLITYHSKDYSIPKIEASLYFLFYTGIRKSEFVGLKRSDIELEENRVKVYGKGQKERYSYFPEKVKQKLINYFNSEPEEKNAFNLTANMIESLVHNIEKYFPEKNITVHLFRHSGAREMLRKGIPLAIVSKILGHTNIATTMIYADENEEGRKNIYKEKMK